MTHIVSWAACVLPVGPVPFRRMSAERIGASGRVTGPAEPSGLSLGRARARALATVARYLVLAKRAGFSVVAIDDLVDLIRVQGVEPETFVDQRRAG